MFNYSCKNKNKIKIAEVSKKNVIKNRIRNDRRRGLKIKPIEEFIEVRRIKW